MRNPKQITIDFEKEQVTVTGAEGTFTWPLESAEGFSAVSKAWLIAGWFTKYPYGFTWLGRPIIQLPEDVLRLQEAYFRAQPDVVIECGVAHGGSLVFYASLCRAMGKGRVIGIDVEIRPQNREALERHPLASSITLIEGSSTSPVTLSKVRALLRPGERVMVVLDSLHTKEHVLAELDAYAGLVSVGSYLVAMDGIMELVAGAPRTRPDWDRNNPYRAVLEFLQRHPEFQSDESFLFNEGKSDVRVTYAPSGFLKRV